MKSQFPLVKGILFCSWKSQYIVALDPNLTHKRQNLKSKYVSNEISWLITTRTMDCEFVSKFLQIKWDRAIDFCAKIKVSSKLNSSLNLRAAIPCLVTWATIKYLRKLTFLLLLHWKIDEAWIKNPRNFLITRNPSRSGLVILQDLLPIISCNCNRNWCSELR